MSVAKVIEISSKSKQSFEDAVKKGIERTSNTVENIQGVWIKEQHVDVENNTIAGYRVAMKVTFLIKE